MDEDITSVNAAHETNLFAVDQWTTYDLNSYLGQVNVDDVSNQAQFFDNIIGTFNKQRFDLGPTLTPIYAIDQSDVFDENNPVYQSMIQYRVSNAARTTQNGNTHRSDRIVGTPLRFFEDFNQGSHSGSVAKDTFYVQK